MILFRLKNGNAEFGNDHAMPPKSSLIVGQKGFYTEGVSFFRNKNLLSYKNSLTKQMRFSKTIFLYNREKNTLKSC